jgi:hypothetical protein
MYMEVKEHNPNPKSIFVAPTAIVFGQLVQV